MHVHLVVFEILHLHVAKLSAIQGDIISGGPAHHTALWGGPGKVSKCFLKVEHCGKLHNIQVGGGGSLVGQQFTGLGQLQAWDWT